LTVWGETLIADFGRKQKRSRRPLARFLEVARAAAWKHMPDVKESFPATDFDTKAETYIFDIGGNSTACWPPSISKSRY
jgi:mRNA-degrading endonuclease HigB of HigAB toxin-antitoxin module